MAVQRHVTNWLVSCNGSRLMLAGLHQVSYWVQLLNILFLLTRAGTKRCHYTLLVYTIFSQHTYSDMQDVLCYTTPHNFAILRQTCGHEIPQENSLVDIYILYLAKIWNASQRQVCHAYLRPPVGRQYGMSISQQPLNRSLPNFQQLLLMSNEGKVESFSSFAYG